MDRVTLPDALDTARITRLPSTAYYIPNFISEEEEKIILDKVRPAARTARLAVPFGLGDPDDSQPPRSPMRPNRAGSNSRTEDFRPGRPISSRTDSSMRPFPPG